MRRRWEAQSCAALACAAALFVAAACRAPREAPAPPMPADLQALDPQVAALLDERLAVLRANPEELASWFELGMAYEANALADLAVACYLQALEQRPTHAKVWYRLGFAYSNLGQGQEALAAWERAAELAPDRPFTHWRLGFAQLDSGELRSARRSFESALAREATSKPARAGLARALLQGDEPEEALELLEVLVAELSDADPNAAALRQLHDRTRRRLSLSAVSSQEVAAAPAVWPDPWASEAGPFFVGFGADLARADAAMSEARYGEALRLLEPHRVERSGEPVFLTTLGVALSRSGRSDEGIAALREALAIDPRRAIARIELADALLRAGRKDEAMAEADRACELAPTDPRAHELRGLVLRVRGRKEAALAAFERAVRLGPERLQALRYLGSLQFETRAFEDALRTYETVLARAPRDENAWMGLGMARLELGLLQEAELALRRAEELGPRRHWEVHVALEELERRRASTGS